MPKPKLLPISKQHKKEPWREEGPSHELVVMAERANMSVADVMALSKKEVKALIKEHGAKVKYKQLDADVVFTADYMETKWKQSLPEKTAEDKPAKKEKKKKGKKKDKKSSDEFDQEEEPVEDKPKRTRVPAGKLFDQPMASVVHWMAQNGMDFDQIKTALSNLVDGKIYADATIKIKIKNADKGDVPVAELTKKQQKEIKAAAK